MFVKGANSENIDFKYRFSEILTVIYVANKENMITHLEKIKIKGNFFN